MTLHLHIKCKCTTSNNIELNINNTLLCVIIQSIIYKPQLTCVTYIVNTRA